MHPTSQHSASTHRKATVRRTRSPSRRRASRRCVASTGSWGRPGRCPASGAWHGSARRPTRSWTSGQTRPGQAHCPLLASSCTGDTPLAAACAVCLHVPGPAQAQPEPCSRQNGPCHCLQPVESQPASPATAGPAALTAAWRPAGSAHEAMTTMGTCQRQPQSRTRTWAALEASHSESNAGQRALMPTQAALGNQHSQSSGRQQQLTLCQAGLGDMPSQRGAGRQLHWLRQTPSQTCSRAGALALPPPLAALLCTHSAA